uniref:Uncharacterized protein n=1 Tax=Rhizophora mucronata TaxID=61149 RepID=A0A2P2NVD6_RHIMU
MIHNRTGCLSPSPRSSPFLTKDMSETRSRFPLLFPRRSRTDVAKNLVSVSSSLLPAFGTTVDEGYLHLKKYAIAPYDRRYR